MPELNLLYVKGESIGYGRYGVHLARELEKLGIDVYDHLPEPDELPRGDQEHLAHLNAGKKSKVCNVVAWVSVPTHARGWWSGQIPVISTMWESTFLPESFRENLHEFDTVVVPSWQNLELFSQYHDNVHFVPLGVDPERWHFTKREDPGTFFNFLIGGSGPRKGTDLAYKAFRRVFGRCPKDGPIPRLIMKNPRGEDFYGDRIELVTGRISPEAEVSLYAQAHCYLQPSRGEGFGLQPLQAMAQGCPTILTAAHGHESFSHLGLGISASLSQSAYFIYGDAGEWWEPNLDELCDRMEYVYNHYDFVCREAESSAREIANHWTWRQTAVQFVDAIGPGRLIDAPKHGDWHKPEAKLYLVRVNKPWRADIAGAQYHFQPDQDYWEPADVKRILFEAGLLDPSCVQQLTVDGHWADNGLLPVQAEKIPEYSAKYAYCELCHQRLGSGVQRADEILKDLDDNAGV